MLRAGQRKYVACTSKWQGTRLSANRPSENLVHADTDSQNFSGKLAYWQDYFNCKRPYGLLSGKSPVDKYSELKNITTFLNDAYSPDQARINNQNYHLELPLLISREA